MQPFGVKILEFSPGGVGILKNLVLIEFYSVIYKTGAMSTRVLPPKKKKQKPDFFKVNQKIKKTIENTGFPRIFGKQNCFLIFWFTLKNSSFFLFWWQHPIGNSTRFVDHRSIQGFPVLHADLLKLVHEYAVITGLKYQLTTTSSLKPNK